AAVPGLVLLLLFGLCVAAITGLLHAHFPDTHHLLEIGLQVAFYLTPILYPPDSVRQRVRLAWVLELHPLGALLALVRAPLPAGESPALLAVLIGVGFVVITALLAWTALRRCERTLVFWI